VILSDRFPGYLEDLIPQVLEIIGIAENTKILHRFGVGDDYEHLRQEPFSSDHLCCATDSAICQGQICSEGDTSSGHLLRLVRHWRNGLQRRCLSVLQE
jgi:hypothetical protein